MLLSQVKSRAWEKLFPFDVSASPARLWVAERFLKGVFPLWVVIYRALTIHMTARGGRVPVDYFETVPRMIPQASIELLIVEMRDGEPWVYMDPRPPNDVYYAGMLHFPGTSMYAMDTLEGMVERLLSSEVAGQIRAEELAVTFVHCSRRGTRMRGAGMHVVCVHELPEGALDVGRLDGDFYPASELALDPFEAPHRVVPEQIDILQEWLMGPWDETEKVPLLPREH